MALKNTQNSNFTNEVKIITSYLNSRTELKDSVVDQAIDFFEENEQTREKLDAFDQQLTVLDADSKSHQKKLTLKKSNAGNQINQLAAEKESYLDTLKALSDERNKSLRRVCYQIIQLSEGENFSETLRKSAQFLGTIQLLSPVSGKKVALVNEQHKALYKAVLCLRLLDELIISGQLNDSYINTFLEDVPAQQYRYFCRVTNDDYQAFIDNVKLPIVMAALLQDIGNYHPEAQAILVGEHGKLDPYRTLSPEERKLLLTINYRETNTYLSDGLGELTYVGNSREERTEFIQAEKDKMTFIQRLLRSAINPKMGIGNLLKVPQIYVSIIMSTKDNYNYKLLPNVYNVLNQTAQHGVCQQTVVDSLYKITGMFPQGYGVTYIPKAMDNTDLDFYEYAVVCQFYPENPKEPKCRQATRNLTYISFGHDITVKRNSNLYFPETKKIFSKVSKKRLLEILEKLVSNVEERKELDILPRCWAPNDYFFHKNHQKLWNRQG